MEAYEALEMEIIVFDEEDVITESQSEYPGDYNNENFIGG